MATNDFLPFATGTGANVASQIDYATDTPTIQGGFVTGVAPSVKLNKVWRQGTSVASMIGAFISGQGFDALDNGDIETLRENFELALLQASGMRKLTANMTLYVATTGSDATGNGSVGLPFATIQKAYDTIAANYNLNGFIATIQLADGTYSEGLTASTRIFGSDSNKVIINGNSTNPANVNIVRTSSAFAFFAYGTACFTIQNMKMSISSGTTVCASRFGNVRLGSGLIFHTASEYHVLANIGGIVEVAGNYSVTGNALAHMVSQFNSVITGSGYTVTLTGTPAFSQQFVRSRGASSIYVPSMTYTGAATGTRYLAQDGASINTNSGGASYFPGSVAGSATTGYYV